MSDGKLPLKRVVRIYTYNVPGILASGDILKRKIDMKKAMMKAINKKIAKMVKDTNKSMSLLAKAFRDSGHSVREFEKAYKRIGNLRKDA